MALRIKLYPNMNLLSRYDNVNNIISVLEEIGVNNGIGNEIAGCAVGEAEEERPGIQKKRRQTPG